MIIVAIFSIVIVSGPTKVSMANPPAVDDVLNSVGNKAGYASMDDTKLANSAFPKLVGRFLGVLLGVLGVIFTVLFVYSGYLWMTAGGDAAALTKAKEIMMRAAIGMIIVVSAYVITYFVVMALTSGDYFQ